MPFRTLLRYRNPDITSDVNHRLRDLVQKGVFFGGDVIPIAGQLSVQVGNLGAVGADGMVTLLEGVPETVTVQAGFAQWVLLRAVYVANDDSIAELEVLTETQYDALTDEEKEQRIKLAKVTLSVTASEVTTDDISFTEADLIDPVGRSKYRGSVATETDLPDFTGYGVSTTNRLGDVYYIEDDRVFTAFTTAGWRPVVGTAEAIELTNHRNNEDDGTVAPDFVEAQHVLVKHRDALYAGTASSVQYGSLGFDFASDNPLVDANYPLTIPRRLDFVGIAGATRIPLTGDYYIGKDGVGTANGYFRLSGYQANRQLVGSDRRVIGVLRILKSDGLSEVTPSVDADDYGFYTDPIIDLDLTVTTDAVFSGSLSVFANVKRTIGTLTFEDFSLNDNGLGFLRPAEDITVIGANFGTISTAIDDVQQALDAIDNELGTQASLDQDVKDAIARIQNGAVYTANPDALSWYGGTGSAIGLLDDDASNRPRVRAVTTDLLFQCPTGRQLEWIVFPNVEMTLDNQSLTLTNNLKVGGWANVGGSTTGSTGDGIFTRGINVGTDAAPTDNDIYARGGGINAGGNTNPASGHGIFTTGVHVGSDTAPNTDQMTVGDPAKTFGLVWDGTDPSIQLDTNDRVWYDRSADEYHVVIATNSEAIVGWDGIRVRQGLHVGDIVTPVTDDCVSVIGNVSAAAFIFGTLSDDDKIEFNDTSNLMSFTIDGGLAFTISPTGIDVQSGAITGVSTFGATSISASSYLESLVWRADANNSLTWVAGTSLTFKLGSVDRGVWGTTGLTIGNGLSIGGAGTPLDDDIILVGGIRAGGGVTDPGAGDAIFTGGLRVGSDGTATTGDGIFAGGITAGGITNPGAGDGIFTNAVRIGGDSVPQTKLQIYTSAVGSFPTNTDVVIEKVGDSYQTFMVSGKGGIIVGDTAVNDIGKFIYDHSTDTWTMTAGGVGGFTLADTSLLAQVGRTAVGDSAALDNSAALKVQSTTRGFLPPVMTTTEKNNISTPTVGLVVFDSTLNTLAVFDGAWRTVNVT